MVIPWLTQRLGHNWNSLARNRLFISIKHFMIIVKSGIIPGLIHSFICLIMYDMYCSGDMIKSAGYPLNFIEKTGRKWLACVYKASTLTDVRLVSSHSFTKLSEQPRSLCSQQRVGLLHVTTYCQKQDTHYWSSNDDGSDCCIHKKETNDDQVKLLKKR
jgi:hypothetical protein